VKNFLAYTLRRLGTDYVDIYQPSARRQAASQSKRDAFHASVSVTRSTPT